MDSNHVLQRPDWPLEMVARTAAAFLDYSSARSFLDAVRKGECPRPSAVRGRRREPVWFRPHLASFTERRHGRQLPLLDDVAGLI